MEKNNIAIVAVILIFFFGLLCGYVLGNAKMNSDWETYFNKYQKQINETCICFEPQVENVEAIKWIGIE